MATTKKKQAEKTSRQRAAPRLSGRSLGRPEGSDGASTRARLLEVAASLFARDGYAGVSMADIAGAAGLTAAAIYNHFGSKDDLFIAATTNMYEEIAGAFAEAASVPGTWRQRLFAMLDMASDVYREDAVLQRLGEVAQVKAHQDPARYNAINNAYVVVQQVFRDVMADARAAGEVPADLDAAMAGDLLCSMVLMGISGVTHAYPSQADFDVLVRAFKLFVGDGA